MKIHEKYIKRCIQLAENGLGKTYPNPMVGSVLMYNDKIIGEGWHREAGHPHAEVNAINSVVQKDLIKKSTIYVSLEPCSHFGKTPPCSDLIIASGIKKVVVGTIDPFTKVAGRGIKKLLAAGCEVIVGILEKECRDLNKRFFTFHEKNRPYIILKWAQSSDAFIAPESREKREPVWITNSLSRQLVHKWRAEEQGILIGTNTAVEDDPKLNTRLWDGPSPVRIAMDRNLRIDNNSSIYNGESQTIIIPGKDNTPNGQFLEQKNLRFSPIDFEKEITQQICKVLFEENLQSVIIEGGSRTLQTFIDAGAWDEARVFTGSMLFKTGVNAPFIKGSVSKDINVGNDNLKIYRND